MLDRTTIERFQRWAAGPADAEADFYNDQLVAIGAVLAAAVAVADAHRTVCEADYDKADEVCEAFDVSIEELAELIPPAKGDAP